MPPSTGTIAPLTYDAAGEAGTPPRDRSHRCARNLPAGCWPLSGAAPPPRRRSAWARVVSSWRTRSVAKRPGATPFMRTGAISTRLLIEPDQAWPQHVAGGGARRRARHRRGEVDEDGRVAALAQMRQRAADESQRGVERALDGTGPFVLAERVERSGLVVHRSRPRGNRAPPAARDDRRGDRAAGAVSRGQVRHAGGSADGRGRGLEAFRRAPTSTSTTLAPSAARTVAMPAPMPEPPPPTSARLPLSPRSTPASSSGARLSRATQHSEARGRSRRRAGPTGGASRRCGTLSMRSVRPAPGSSEHGRDG